MLVLQSTLRINQKDEYTCWVLDQLVSDLIEFEARYVASCVSVTAGDFNSTTGQTSEQVQDEEAHVVLQKRKSNDSIL